MIADTTSALYVWEHEFYPQYYLPMECFVQPAGYEVKLSHGEAIVDNHNKIVGGGLEFAVRRANSNDAFEVLNDMVLFAADLVGPAAPLSNYVKIIFKAVGQSAILVNATLTKLQTSGSKKIHQSTFTPKIRSKESIVYSQACPYV